ncbi:hypothetical protein HDV05_002493, partial [Chytridiales sp. JEL 0842]
IEHQRDYYYKFKKNRSKQGGWEQKAYNKILKDLQEKAKKGEVIVDSAAGTAGKSKLAETKGSPKRISSIKLKTSHESKDRSSSSRGRRDATKVKQSFNNMSDQPNPSSQQPPSPPPPPLIEPSKIPTHDSKPILLGLPLPSFTSLLLSTKKTTSNEPLIKQKYRVDQVWDGIYNSFHESFEDIQTLPKGLAKELEEMFEISTGKVLKGTKAGDGTVKWLIGFPARERGTATKKKVEENDADPTEDEEINITNVKPPTNPDLKDFMLNAVETVYIPQTPTTYTACVSTQVGCSLACSFCYTGTQKFQRNLNAAEIVEQLMWLVRLHGGHPVNPDFKPVKSPPTLNESPISDVFPESEQDPPRRLSHVVFMGQGEPLLNYPALRSAIHTYSTAFQLPLRRTTVSTSGIAPLIPRLATEIGCDLALSLHATTNELRDTLVPLNKQYNLPTLVQALEDFHRLNPATGNRRNITLEYIMLHNVNDTPQDAWRLVSMFGHLPVHVNLIPFNQWPGSGFEVSTEERIREFQRIVREGKRGGGRTGVECTVRWSKGREDGCGCGQLKSGAEEKKRRVQGG